jgi:hypothetical protein
VDTSVGGGHEEFIVLEARRRASAGEDSASPAAAELDQEVESDSDPSAEIGQDSRRKPMSQNIHSYRLVVMK